MAEQLIPKNVRLKFVWGRSKCSMRRNIYDEYYFEKRLEKVKSLGYQLDKILIVDDTHEKSRTNYGNAIHIKAFEGEGEDNELTPLFQYLLSLKYAANVRSIEKRAWRTAYP